MHQILSQRAAATWMVSLVSVIVLLSIAVRSPAQGSLAPKPVKQGTMQGTASNRTFVIRRARIFDGERV